MFNFKNDNIDSDFESQLTDDENSFKKSDEESLNEKGDKMSFEEPPSKPTSMVTKNWLKLAFPHRKETLLDRKIKPFQKLLKGQNWGSRRTKKRDELFFKHKADEAQRTREYKAEEASKNREHEIRLAQIYASVRPTSYLGQGNQWHLSAYWPYMQNLSGNGKNIQANEFGQCEYLSHNHNQLRPSTYQEVPQN